MLDKKNISYGVSEIKLFRKFRKTSRKMCVLNVLNIYEGVLYVSLVIGLHLRLSVYISDYFGVIDFSSKSEQGNYNDQRENSRR